MTELLITLGEILLAQAEGGEPSGAPEGPMSFLANPIFMMVLMFGVIYFLLIRPASKQKRQHADLLSALKKDDEVVTSGGIYGRVVGIDEKIVTLEISDRVKIRILRDRIAGKWNPEPAAAATPAKK